MCQTKQDRLTEDIALGCRKFFPFSLFSFNIERSIDKTINQYIKKVINRLINNENNELTFAVDIVTLNQYAVVVLMYSIYAVYLDV